MLGRRISPVPLVNSYDDIKSAFAPYYTTTLLANSVTPSAIYDLEARIDAYALSDSETVQNGSILGDMILGTTTLGEAEKGWLDLSPFVFYMLDVFEHCLTDATLSKNVLTESEKKLLNRMNKIGMNAEITTKKATGILQLSESATRAVLKGLVDKGYLSVDASKSTFIYRLQQHFVE